MTRRAAAAATRSFAFALAAAAAAPAQDAAPPPSFVERRDCGLDFVHRRFMTPHKKYLPETAGSGVALLDYDRDGDLDVYCVQCCPLPGYPGPEEAPPDALYRNEGGLRFSRVPDEWTEPRLDERGEAVVGPDGQPAVQVKRLGLGDREYGMGATAPDVDNDGWPDLYVTNVGRNVLYRNNRDGTFSDVTAESGLGDDSWSTAAGWADLDRDGDLDLYLCNYALIDFENYKVCGTPEKVGYCHPDTLRGAADRLFRNDGGFRFADVTESSGIVEPGARMKGLAVLPFDHDGDGLLDLFVANDADPNFLWINRGGLKFEEQAGELNVALGGKGASQSCMGTDIADVDGDLDFDLFSANFGKEPNVLYVRVAPDFYDDRNRSSGLGEPSFLFTGFGARFLDFDRDADQDLMVVNGHIMDNAHEMDPSQTFEQVPHLYVNRGNGAFDERGAELSPFFLQPNVGRGLACGDLDDDGDLDAVVLENDHPIALLENRHVTANGWIGFALAGTRSPRDAIGATVVLECAGRRQIQLITGSASYLCWNDLRVHFGVGAADAAKTRARAVIRWPSGCEQVLEGLELGRYHAVNEPAAQ